MRDRLPLLPAGVYRHYKGDLYMVIGYGRDSNIDGREVVVYVGLELSGALMGPRIQVREVADFHAVVEPATGSATGYPNPSPPDYPLRFTYIGPSWEGSR